MSEIISEQSVIINEQQTALVPFIPAESDISTIIIIEQLPVIKEQLKLIREDVKQSVEQALSMAVTEDTVKAVKAVRAKLTKDFKACEDKRKEVRKLVLTPYEEFEAVYKECVTSIYAPADAQLKQKIDEVENGLKEARRAEVTTYFAECCQSHNIDFLAFNQSGIDVNLTASKKALKEQAKAFVDKVADELSFIATQEHQAEVLVEYKKLLNAVQAVTLVNKRHQELEAERERVRLAQEAREARELAARKVDEAMREQAAIQAAQAAQAAQVQHTPPGMSAVASMLAPPAAPVAPPVAMPVPAPIQTVPQADEKHLTAKFKLKNANAQQLMSAISFMSEQGFNYSYEITVTDTRSRLLLLKRALQEGGCEIE
jgi:hypothetical protein